MFKKRKAPSHTIDLLKDAEEIHITLEPQDTPKMEEEPAPKPKPDSDTKRLNAFSLKQTKHIESTPEMTEYDRKVGMGLVPKHNVKYGLIEKEQTEQAKVESNFIMEMYVKEKMEQMRKKEQPKPSTKMQTASQVFQMERRFLQPTESKIASYDVGEVQKKLELLSAELIKAEQEKRRDYLKSLLDNDLERMQYASKKQLKEIRQERERTEKYIQANYKEEGRRHEINKMKRDAFNKR